MEEKEKCYHCDSEKLIEAELEAYIRIRDVNKSPGRYHCHNIICLDCNTIVRSFIIKPDI